MWISCCRRRVAVLCTLALLACASTAIGEDNNTAEGLDRELSDMVLTTALGKIRGTLLPSQIGRNFYAFRGIPYAKPPVGALRFKPPEPVDQWFDIFDATFDGPRCPQPGLYSDDVAEDCLRVNIYTRDLPTEKDPNVKKPVIVFIHPGGFYALSGQSKNFAGPQYFMDRNILLVTFNYRLGSLGFMSTGTEDALGNMGLKDQVMLMRWVKLHISRFGGDPNSVTLLGYGAGAISITLHMVSPMSRNLFHKAIVMSGSVTGQWLLPVEQLGLAVRQAALLHCTTENLTDMMSCLNSVHLNKTFCLKNFSILLLTETLPRIRQHFAAHVRVWTEQPVDTVETCYRTGLWPGTLSRRRSSAIFSKW